MSDEARKLHELELIEYKKRLEKLEEALNFYVENKDGMRQMFAVFGFIKDAIFAGLKKLASAILVGGSLLTVSAILLAYDPLRKLLFALFGIKDD